VIDTLYDGGYQGIINVEDASGGAYGLCDGELPSPSYWVKMVVLKKASLVPA
jgi:hypothetical protein